ncbi:hypothetical protein ACP4OV_006462 [Aristida adscensionis]
MDPVSRRSHHGELLLRARSIERRSRAASPLHGSGLPLISPRLLLRAQSIEWRREESVMSPRGRSKLDHPTPPRNSHHCMHPIAIKYLQATVYLQLQLPYALNPLNNLVEDLKLTTEREVFAKATLRWYAQKLDDFDQEGSLEGMGSDVAWQ